MYDVLKMHKIIDITTNSSGCTLNNENIVENHLWKNILFSDFPFNWLHLWQRVSSEQVPTTNM